MYIDHDQLGKFAADKLPGGLADGVSNKKHDEEELAEGAETELEHTDDFDTSVEIAKDHLEEIPDYYTRLEAMEERAEEGKPEPGAEKEKEAMANNFNALDVADFLIEKAAECKKGKKKKKGCKSHCKKADAFDQMMKNQPRMRQAAGANVPAAKPGLGALKTQTPQMQTGPVTMGNMLWDRITGKNRRYN